MVNLSIGQTIGILFAGIVLIFYVLPGVLGIVDDTLSILLTLAFYLAIGWLMIKLIEMCLQDGKKDKGGEFK
jgi:peptidoglycan/LPS O-acetylase OafA/YrhL